MSNLHRRQLVMTDVHDGFRSRGRKSKTSLHHSAPYPPQYSSISIRTSQTAQVVHAARMSWQHRRDSQPSHRPISSPKRIFRLITTLIAIFWFSGRLQLLPAELSDVKKPENAKDKNQAESFKLDGAPDRETSSSLLTRSSLSMRAGLIRTSTSYRLTVS